MYWLRFCAVLLAFAFTTHACAVCHVPVKDKASVTALALKMAKSVGPCVDPNPSVLLALNLDDNMDPEARNLLVKQLKDDAVVKVSQNLTFSSGKAALYTLALRSSCFDPSKIPKPGGNLNLVTVLEEKTKAELTSIEKNKFPRTNFYQVALDVLALCVMSSPLAEKAGATLAKAVPAKPSGPEFTVDTAAMAVMGFTCVQSMDNIPPKTKSSVKQAQSVLLDLMMAQQNNNGMIGNIYSTGLAGQALTAAKAYYPREAWNCSLTLQKILEEIPIGTFSLPITTAQVLPYLYGRSYFSVKEIQCPTSNTTLITVEYTIINNIVEKPFKYTIFVEVPEGSTFLHVMERAAVINPKEFSFESTESEWGTFVESINGLKGNTNQKTYWQFFNDTTPFQVGVGLYIPKNMEHIVVIFSKY